MENHEIESFEENVTVTHVYEAPTLVETVKGTTVALLGTAIVYGAAIGAVKLWQVGKAIANGVSERRELRKRNEELTDLISKLEETE